MKRIIDVDEKLVCEGFVRNFTEEERDMLIRAIGNSKPYEEGEWIKVKEERMSIDMSGEIVTRYKCSKCGRLITVLPSKLAAYPFCHCGADMRKGGAQNESFNE